jgi:hypothetical protein
MSVQEFGTKYRASVKRDRGDDTLTITGKRGNIYEYSESELGVMFIPTLRADQPPKARVWNALRQEAKAAGMVLRQDADSEGAFSFDPCSETQCRLALKIAGVRKRRQLSPEHASKLAAAGRRALQNRMNPALQRGYSA